MALPTLSNEATIYLDDDAIDVGEFKPPVQTVGLVHSATMTLPAETWDFYKGLVAGGEPGLAFIDDPGPVRPAQPNRAERRRAAALGRRPCS